MIPSILAVPRSRLRGAGADQGHQAAATEDALIGADVAAAGERRGRPALVEARADDAARVAGRAPDKQA